MKTASSKGGSSSTSEETRDDAKLLEDIIRQSTSSEAEAEQIRIALHEFVKPTLDGETTSQTVISRIDELILGCKTTLSAQLNEIVSHEDFRRLEAKWLDLQRLVTVLPLGTDLLLELWPASREDVLADLDESQGDMLRTRLYDVICREPVDALGAIPITLAVLGWQFDPGPQSMRVMNHVADVLEAACVPAVADASPDFFGIADFSALMRHPGDLKELFQDDRYAEYRSFRETSKSRFLGLCLPSYLARLPYGEKTGVAEGAEFFEEAADGPDSGRFVWGSLATVYAGLIGIALSETGWPSRTTGWLGGGRSDDMPLYTFTNAAGATETRPPTQTVIDAKLEPALASLGFISAQWKAGTPSIVFDAAVSNHRPKETTDEAANASDQILSRLPLLCATCRVGAHLRVMNKDLVGANWDAGQIKTYLTSWINRIVVANDASPEVKAKHPLKSAEIGVEPASVPGSYIVTAKLEHWVPIDTLSVAISVVPPSAPDGR